jgi:hypothetical protein
MKVKREDHAFKKIIMTLDSKDEADELWIRLSIRPSMVDAAQDTNNRLKSNDKISTTMFDEFNKLYKHSKLERDEQQKVLKHSRV